MRRLAGFLLILFCLAHAVDAGAGTPFSIVYTPWPPYTFEEQGKATGFEIDILNAVLPELGLEPEYVQLPWKRCLNYLESGQADALVSLLKAPERADFTIYPQENISVSRLVLFTTSANPFRFNGDLRSLRKHTIGVILGFSYGEVFDQTDYLDKDPAVDAASLIRKVLSGHNELGLENEYVIRTTAQTMKVTNLLKFLYPPMHEQKLFVGFSKAKRHWKLTMDFSEALSRFKKTERYQAILRKYGLEN